MALLVVIKFSDELVELSVKGHLVCYLTIKLVDQLVQWFVGRTTHRFSVI